MNQVEGLSDSGGHGRGLPDELYRFRSFLYRQGGLSHPLSNTPGYTPELESLKKGRKSLEMIPKRLQGPAHLILHGLRSDVECRRDF